MGQCRTCSGHVLALARNMSLEEQPQVRWRVMVAGDLAQTDAAIAGFNRVLALSLGVLLLLLGAAAWMQVRVGLGPLRALLQEVQALREGRRQRLAALHAELAGACRDQAAPPSAHRHQPCRRCHS